MKINYEFVPKALTIASSVYFILSLYIVFFAYVQLKDDTNKLEEKLKNNEVSSIFYENISYIALIFYIFFIDYSYYTFYMDDYKYCSGKPITIVQLYSDKAKMQ